MTTKRNDIIKRLLAEADVFDNTPVGDLLMEAAAVLKEADNELKMWETWANAQLKEEWKEDDF